MNPSLMVPYVGHDKRLQGRFYRLGSENLRDLLKATQKNMAQTAKEQMSLYYQFFTCTSCSQTFKLQGTLFSGSCIALLTAEPGYLLPPHCVNDIH